MPVPQQITVSLNGTIINQHEAICLGRIRSAGHHFDKLRIVFQNTSPDQNLPGIQEIQQTMFEEVQKLVPMTRGKKLKDFIDYTYDFTKYGYMHNILAYKSIRAIFEKTRALHSILAKNRHISENIRTNAFYTVPGDHSHLPVLPERLYDTVKRIEWCEQQEVAGAWQRHGSIRIPGYIPRTNSNTNPTHKPEELTPICLLTREDALFWGCSTTNRYSNKPPKPVKKTKYVRYMPN